MNRELAREMHEMRQRINALERRLAKVPLVPVRGGGGGAGAALGTGTPDAVAATGSAGTDTDAAPFDHVHAGIPPAETVDELPAIPSTGARIVYWTDTAPGDGDDQLWIAYAGQTAWQPLQKSTILSGTP